MRSRPFTSGGETKTWRSKRPGRSSAGSSFSSRFEAAMTTTRPSAAEAKPSISTSSWLSVCSRSELLSEPRRAPTASSSSMKMIAGCAARASRNRRRMRAAPRPANISTNDDADCEKKCAPDSWATALASSVLPVPGGPWRRTPLGTLAPRRSNCLGERRKSTTSRSSAFASSTPAMSSQPTSRLASGLISIGLVCGIRRRVRQRTTISATMKRIAKTACQLLAKSRTRSSTLGAGGTAVRATSRAGSPAMTSRMCWRA